MRVSEMTRMKNAIIAVLAVIGICAVIYLSWQAYQHHAQQQRNRAFITSPPQAYKPGTAAPPPQ